MDLRASWSASGHCVFWRQSWLDRRQPVHFPGCLAHFGVGLESEVKHPGGDYSNPAVSRAAPVASRRGLGMRSAGGARESLFPVAILAGGIATRLQPYTEKIPKSLVDV